MRQDIETEFQRFFIEDYSLECGDTKYVLTPFQTVVANILYWARNKNIGKKGAMRLQFYPGPRGKITRPKHIWFPSPDEGCDACVIQYQEEPGENPKKKRVFIPWAWWKHCKTRQHVTYLVAHRLAHVMGVLGPYPRTQQLVHLVTSDDAPLYISDEDEVVSMFARDILAGKVELTQKEGFVCDEVT